MSGYTVKPPTGDTNEQTQFIDYFNLFYSKRGQEQISISQQLGNYGTTFFSASRQSYWNTSRSDQQISFGLNVPFGDITTSLNYSYSNNIWQNDRDHLLAFTLNVPFSHWMRTDSQSAFRNSNASYSMSNDLKGGMTNLSGVYGTLLPDNNLNYSVQVGNTHGGNTSSGTSGYSSLNYRGAYGNTNVGYSRSGDSSQIYYGMSGGIIAHADGITFGQPLGDTMVLVKAPGADNVKIENQTGIHTDWRGYAILQKRFLLATFCALFTATLQAADVTITVNGRVVAKPCTIQTKEANVNLGDLYTRNLQQPGSASGWHNITLSLTDCPVETSAVTAIVTGSTDNTGYYKNEGTAENIQIELRDDQDAALKNGDSKTVIVDEITRNAQFPLKARAITVNGNASQGTIEALINVIYTWQ